MDQSEKRKGSEATVDQQISIDHSNNQIKQRRGKTPLAAMKKLNRRQMVCWQKEKKRFSIFPTKDEVASANRIPYIRCLVNVVQ